MNIRLSEYAGFCPGVRRADESVLTLLKNKQDRERIFTLGHLIHNRLYNEDLEHRGVKSIEFADVEKEYLNDPTAPMTVIIRTHGVTKDQSDFLSSFAEEHENFKFFDATCPFVKRIHKIAKENTNDNTYFLLFSNPSHPEAICIMSYAKGDKLAFSSYDELKSIDFKGKIPIL